jgi:hypothetical protein
MSADENHTRPSEWIHVTFLAYIWRLYEYTTDILSPSVMIEWKKVTSNVLALHMHSN